MGLDVRLNGYVEIGVVFVLGRCIEEIAPELEPDAGDKERDGENVGPACSRGGLTREGENQDAAARKGDVFLGDPFHSEYCPFLQIFRFSKVYPVFCQKSTVFVARRGRVSISAKTYNSTCQR